MIHRTALLAGLLLATGCSLVVEDGIGGLMVSDASKHDIRVTMLDMVPHVSQLTDVQIIRPSDPPVVEARAISASAGIPCYELTWPLGASLGATRLDAFGEDSNAAGVGGDQGNNSADFAGAVYAVRRISYSRKG